PMRFRCALLTPLALALLALATPAAQAACANEQTRAEQGALALPDCRAYEKASPDYKEGYTPFITKAGVSSDGSKFFAESLGMLSGTPGAGEDPLANTIYLDTHTASGWQFEPVNPSAEQFVGQLAIAQEPDNGLSLWEQHTLSQSAFTRDLYLRTTSGKFDRVGPVGVPFPGEETKGGDSLYGLCGLEDNERQIFEVNGPKGSKSLVSPCGAQLGSGTGSVYN